MLSQWNPPCSAMDQSDPDLPPSTNEVAVEGGQRNRGGVSLSSPESSSVNGDGNRKRSGKSRCRRKRSTQPDNHPASIAVEMHPPPLPGQGDSSHAPVPDSPSMVLLGMGSECESVWFDRGVYEQAESLYQCWLAHSANGAKTRPSSSPSLSALAADNHPTSPQPSSPAPNHPITPPTIVAEPAAPEFLALPANSGVTPDEGYLSLAQTSQAASPLTSAQAPGQLMNGLPCLPPLYDRAEAAFYQNLYGNNRSHTCNNLDGGASTSRTTPNAHSTSRCIGDQPQSLMEEEEVLEEAAMVSQGKVEVYHSLLTIQEEPADITDEEGGAMSVGGVCYFLHPERERVWLDRGHYEDAEIRFYDYYQNVPVESTVTNREEEALGEEDTAASATSSPASPVACNGPLRDNTMSAAVDYLAQEKIWFDKPCYHEAERHFYEQMNGTSHPAQELVGANSILQDIARARENIQKSLAGVSQQDTRETCQDRQGFPDVQALLKKHKETANIEDRRLTAADEIHIKLPFTIGRCPAVPSAQNWQKIVGPCYTRLLSREVLHPKAIPPMWKQGQATQLHENRGTGVQQNGRRCSGLMSKCEIFGCSRR
uniref:Uncharacterized protein n=1 Tax=Oncorhynchus kisutch TaxID=8019 RepID=A0A8C7MP24_ONCKI